MEKINIIDDVLQEKYWRYEPGSYHYSNHKYRNNPYETDTDCGNCDGALCNYCIKISDDSKFEFNIGCIDLEFILMKHGVLKEDAVEISTAERSLSSGNHTLKWPHDYDLLENHKDFYDRLYEPDSSIINILDNVPEGIYPSINYLCDKLNMQKPFYMDNDFAHARNQYLMWKYNMWKYKEE